VVKDTHDVNKDDSRRTRSHGCQTAHSRQFTADKRQISRVFVKLPSVGESFRPGFALSFGDGEVERAGDETDLIGRGRFSKSWATDHYQAAREVDRLMYSTDNPEGIWRSQD
jgi:hypothetical protein